jgi:UDP-N-acetyl-D-mannosaminuronate dehydrogenase
MRGSATDLASRLDAAIDARTAKVGVIGLGYVGLPLVLEFHRGGFPVMGFDIDERKVDALRAGTSYIAHIDAARIRDAVKGGRFDATSDFRRLAEADAILICVPTPLTRQREPDLSYIEKTADAIAAALRPGQLVVLESTTYPGTTEEVVQPRLEAGGKRVERDYFLAFSPEREDPGNPDYSTRSIPKVVGGVGPESARLAEALYRGALDRVVRVSSARVAEAVKILENTYRAVNIALVNELKVTFDAMGIDVWEVIEAARTKPFGYAAFYPGPGLGGHCLSGHETVCIRDGPAVRVLPLDKVFDSAPARRRVRVREVDVTVPDDLEVLSVDPASGETRFSAVSHLFRRAAPTPLLRLRLKDNRRLTVTDGHPMLCCDERGIDVRPARDLRAGDQMVVVRSWPADSAWTPCLEQIQAERTDTVELATVEPAPSEPVYSMEVEGTGTFVTSYGIAVHNCIPIDPFYLTWKAREYGLSTRFIELAGEVNTGMPGYVVRRLASALNEAGKPLRGTRVLVLGAAYKKNIADVRESPALEIIEMLQEAGVRVDYHDPHIPLLPKGRRHQIELSSVALDGLAQYDAAVVVTDHAGVDYQAVAAAVPLIVDTRNVYGGPAAGRARIVKA